MRDIDLVSNPLRPLVAPSKTNPKFIFFPMAASRTRRLKGKNLMKKSIPTFLKMADSKTYSFNLRNGTTNYCNRVYIRTSASVREHNSCFSHLYPIQIFLIQFIIKILHSVCYCIPCCQRWSDMSRIDLDAFFVSQTPSVHIGATL